MQEVQHPAKKSSGKGEEKLLEETMKEHLPEPRAWACAVAALAEHPAWGGRPEPHRDSRGLAGRWRQSEEPGAERGEGESGARMASQVLPLEERCF